MEKEELEVAVTNLDYSSVEFCINPNCDLTRVKGQTVWSYDPERIKVMLDGRVSLISNRCDKHQGQAHETVER